jgi:hypothetical protein
MAIALVAAGSFNASVSAQRSRRGDTTTLGGTDTSSSSSSSSSGPSPKSLMSKFVSCVREAGSGKSSVGTTSSSSSGSGMLTRADVTDCYDTVYRGGGSSLGSSSGSLGSSSGSLGSSSGSLGSSSGSPGSFGSPSSSSGGGTSP